MASPHAKFVKYLVSRKEQDIGGVLEDYDLPIPVNGMLDIERMEAEISPFPSMWSPSLLRTNIQMRRWLARVGLLGLWEKPALVRDCMRLLRNPKAREALEVGLLRRTSPSELAGDVSALADTLVTADLVSVFEATFFNVSMTGARDWVQYLYRRPNAVLREEIEHLKDTRSRSRSASLPEENDLSTLNEIVRLATRKMRDLSVEPTSGANAIAMAQLAKVSTEAIQRKVEIRKDMGEELADDDILGQWHEQFELTTIAHSQAIISLEQLETNPQRAIGVSNE